jgi:hypothetical protein
MTKKPEEEKKIPSANVSADGPIPAENWDNDQRFTGNVDKSPGSIYDLIVERDKAKKPA